MNSIKNETNKIRIDETKEYIAAGLEIGIDLINKEIQGGNIKLCPKLIVYLNYEEIDELYSYMSLLKNYQLLYPNIQLFLMFENSFVFLLRKGMNLIYLPDTVFTKKGVGFYPTQNSIFSTKGFKWDVGKLYFN